MTATLIPGQVTWSSSRDNDGHRTYKVKHLVQCDFLDGPSTVSQCPGLPVVGSTWHFDNDLDLFAYCSPEYTVSIHSEKEGERARFWIVENTFTTKAFTRCNDTQVENPLQEPMRISGGFTRDRKEFPRDRFGKIIRNSSFEPYKGPLVEFDRSHPTVRVEQNVAQLDLQLFSSMMNTVNANPLWGLSSRTILLTTASWERKVYGSCFYYYVRSFEFEVQEDTHDRWIPDEGSKCLRGHWPSGDGLTFLITSVSGTGGITGVSIVNGGSGYPVNSTTSIPSVQDSSGGSGAVLGVGINSKGQVFQLNIVSAGTGYSISNPKLPIKVAPYIGDWTLESFPVPNINNPQDYVKYKDKNHENAITLLNGAGQPLKDGLNPVIRKVEGYPEVDFLSLGIPTSL